MFQLDLHENMSKADEIQVFYDLYKVLPKDSYLVELLSGLPEYLEVQIHNDYNESIITMLENRNNEINKLECDNKNLNERYEGQVHNIKELQMKANQLDELRENEKSQYYKELGEIRTKLKSAVDENSLLCDEITSRDNEIVRLKANLYDFMISEEEA